MEEKKEEKIFRDIVKILEQDVPQEALAEGNPTPEQEAIALIKQELDKAREEGYEKGYEKGLEDLHSNDIYQKAIYTYGEWDQIGMDRGFEEARKELLSKLTTK